MFQAWQQLLFLHWEVDPAVIQATLPPGLTVDTFDGRAYLGVVPFYMRGIRPRFCPPVPGISNFLEINLRTYVYDEQGVPGVWFYSLDANQRLAVWAARTFFKLPYFVAQMSAVEAIQNGPRHIDYATKRRADPSRQTSRFSYRGVGPIRTATPGSFEFFLAERYILFAFDPRTQTLFSGQVHHPPYPLQDAEVDQYSAHLISLAGFAAPQRPPDHALFSAGVSVDVFAIKR
jgi:uncharacterized protein YqjF (DUF2071 family)